jgi:hypothetical protein
MHETAAHSECIKQQVKDIKPPLSPFVTTPKNFARFVGRVGILVSIQDTVIDLITWKHPAHSIIAIFIYTFLCLNPRYLILIPHAVIFYHIGLNYYRKAKNIQIKKSKYSANVQYLKNMQFIQNGTGAWSDLHDTVKKKLKSLNWNDETATLNILKLASYSFFAIYILLTFVPLNYICLLGLAVFIQNSAFFRAANQVLLPIIHRKMTRRVDELKTKFNNFGNTNAAPDDPSVTVVNVFENQRWWAGMFTYCTSS